MKDTLINVPGLDLEEIIQIFQLIYTLPKYSEQIKDTLPDTDERNSKHSELKNKILSIYNFLKHEEISFMKDLNSSNYQKQIDILKNKLIDQIKIKFPETTIYLIINEFHNKLNQDETKICVIASNVINPGAEPT